MSLNGEEKSYKTWNDLNSELIIHSRDILRSRVEESWGLIISLNSSFNKVIPPFPCVATVLHRRRRLKKNFCCVIVFDTGGERRAISQNMPTIVYQTNRYLSDAFMMAWPDNTGTFLGFFQKSIFHLYGSKNISWVIQEYRLNHRSLFFRLYRIKCKNWASQINSN